MKNIALLFKNEIAGRMSGYFGMDADEVLESLTEFDITSLSSDTFESNSDSDFDIVNNLIKFDSVQLVGAEIKNPGMTGMVGG